MPPCISRGLWIALLVVVWVRAPWLAAQPGSSPAVHYHFGDDRHWADTELDDSAWPVASQGRWPVPPFYSDGFVWIRLRFEVPGDSAGPLSIRDTDHSSLGADLNATEANEIFVNGWLVGARGSFPPHAVPVLSGQDAVLDLPRGLAVPGKTAVIALRAWYPPFERRTGILVSERFAIDERRNLQLAANAEHSATMLAGGPDLALNLLITLMGIGLLVFWRSARGRELLVCAAMLITFPLFNAFIALSELGFVGLHWRVDSLVWALLRTAGMLATIEFVWTIHDLRSLGVKRFAQTIALLRNALPLIGQLTTVPSVMVHISVLALRPASNLFDTLIISANLWALLIRKRNRLIAGALALVPITSLLSWFGWMLEGRIGPFHFDYFNVAYFIAALALFVSLGQRAWVAWRGRDELRVELEAAREVQQQLVAPAVDIPGFKIESAYIPAKQVGGDFFRVIPEDGAGVLIVVGDVSGKGLRAAMTVAAVVGALRTVHPVSPAWIINALNSGLIGNLRGGFVTCCAARITHDGVVTIANAGHLPPYRNGAEMDLAAGLPLGIDANADYEESHFQLQSLESLTFVSDGIIEARNAAGELFGFERTLKISSSSAETIAQAAVAFGQDDDITVLKMTWLGTTNIAATSSHAAAAFKRV